LKARQLSPYKGYIKLAPLGLGLCLAKGRPRLIWN
jgi:hypothetical protein